jgi:hypothetical protein
MKAAGIAENEMRPVYTMLASCHTELRRRLVAQTGNETDDSRAHYERARQFLQRLYGSNTPEPPTIAHDLLSFADLNLKSSDPSAIQPTAHSSAQEDQDAADDLEMLQERYASQLAQYTKLNSEKRKVEDELAYERTQRRRLELEKENLARQLATSEERESRIRGQLQSVSSERQKAIEFANLEEKRREQAQKGSQSLLEELAQVIRRAAADIDSSKVRALDDPKSAG